MHVDITTWCPTAKAKIRLTVETRFDKPVVGDIVKGKAVQCSLNRECPPQRHFCWLRSEEIESRL